MRQAYLYDLRCCCRSAGCGWQAGALYGTATADLRHPPGLRSRGESTCANTQRAGSSAMWIGRGSATGSGSSLRAVAGGGKRTPRNAPTHSRTGLVPAFIQLSKCFRSARGQAAFPGRKCHRNHYARDAKRVHIRRGFRPDPGGVRKPKGQRVIQGSANCHLPARADPQRPGRKP